jgi:hypothetical protein
MATKKDAMVKEAVGEKSTFTFKGLELAVSAGGKMPTAAIKAWERGHIVTFLEIMLGPDQWARVEPKVPTIDDIQDLASAMNDAMGASSGE